MIVEVYRGLCHHDIPAGVWRWNGHFDWRRRGIVCQVDDQMIARMKEQSEMTDLTWYDCPVRELEDFLDSQSRLPISAGGYVARHGADGCA